MAVKIYPTFNNDNHIHIVAGNPSTVDLFLGDDDQYVKLEQNHGNIVVGTNTNTNQWTFGTDGTLEFPQGSTIRETIATTGTHGTTIIQAHIQNDLLLNTYDYVNSTLRTWTFGTDGVLTLSTASTILGSGTDPNVYIETATTSTTSTWTFGTDGVLTLPAATPVIKGGGTGTDVTVVATTGTNTATWVFGASGAVTFPNGGVIGTAFGDNAPNLIGTEDLYAELLSYDKKSGVWVSDQTYSNPVGGGVGIATNSDPVTGVPGNQWAFKTDGTTTLASGVEISNTGTFNFLSWNTGTALIIADVPYTAGSYIYIPSSSDTNGSLGIVNTNTAGSIMLTQGSGNNTTNQLYVNNSGTTINNILGGISKTWTFGTNGSVTFPDATVQTTAYVPATASASTYTGWFKAAGTVVQLDTLLARINSTGTMQISSTIVETIGTGAAFAWNGVRNQGATMSAFGQGGENWVMPGSWLDISATPLNNNFEVATVSVFKLGGTGSLYRITYVGATNDHWSVVIERVALG